MCTPKQSPAPAQKPPAALLGDGMASNAALAITNRKKQLDDAISKAGG